MMKNVLEYKGYHTVIKFDADTLTLRGKIEGIDDFVDFQSGNLTTIEEAFHNAVDEYLAFCKEIGKEPEKEYKGTFNVRIESSLHRRLAMYASRMGESLNSTVEKAIETYVEDMENKKNSNVNSK